MIKELIFNNKLDLFEKLIKIYPENPTILFTTLLETTTALRRDGKNIDLILDKDFIEIFQELKSKKIGKEAIEEIMITKTEYPNLTINQIKEKLNIESISTEELNKIILKIIKKNIQVIKEKEMRAVGPLMGEIMEEVRGKIDGAIVSKELKNHLQKKLKELK
jgi:glutamyl-tRNA(Gln) amidotransferase subunit E